MSLLKKIEADINQADLDILQALKVELSIEEMLEELQQSGKIKLKENPIINEDQGLREA